MSSTILQGIKQSCRKVVCVGRNYAAHVTELSSARPKQPFYFLKPPSSILLPSCNEGPFLLPRGTTVHHEVELALLISKPVRNLSPDENGPWREFIHSYLLAIDMTARNVQDEAKDKGLPWTIAKGFDTFLPLAGPISADKVKDPHDVELWLDVNGTRRQEDSTALMMFRIARQLSDISKVMTLEKGDIVLTGTPKGVGPVKKGDIITAGMRINGKDVDEARLEVHVEDRPGIYNFAET